MVELDYEERGIYVIKEAAVCPRKWPVRHDLRGEQTDRTDNNKNQAPNPIHGHYRVAKH